MPPGKCMRILMSMTQPCQELRWWELICLSWHWSCRQLYAWLTTKQCTSILENIYTCLLDGFSLSDYCVLVHVYKVCCHSVYILLFLKNKGWCIIVLIWLKESSKSPKWQNGKMNLEKFFNFFDAIWLKCTVSESLISLVRSHNGLITIPRLHAPGIYLVGTLWYDLHPVTFRWPFKVKNACDPSKWSYM